ncbi:TIGR01212 family radical SAM protein, partial [Thiotrichales bacterium HSG1]|nr:TIGR01212 family radical SAM protein [Thiotrichales bacterium HSG1]
FLAYFQAYTNTYADVKYLTNIYEQALSEPDIVGLSIGTRPDCVPESVLNLLVSYKERGYEIWLELGLQSAFDSTLERINRGHGFAEYKQVVKAAKLRDIPVCTHIIIGLPGEERQHNLTSLERILELGVDGLKLHPLHVVKHTVLAKQWREKEYQPLDKLAYISIATDMIEKTPVDVAYHRVTATASTDILLAPTWCDEKWTVLNGITTELHRRGSKQGIKN